MVVLDCLTLWVANLMGRGRDDPEIMAEGDRLVAVLTGVSFGDGGRHRRGGLGNRAGESHSAPLS